MYLTGTLPYLLLLPMLVCVCSLEGALPGVKFFLTPGWDALQKLQVNKQNEILTVMYFICIPLYLFKDCQRGGPNT